MFNISYDGYNFHETGVPTYGHSMQPDGESALPRKLTETFRVKHTFYETSFADNEARWKTLKDKCRTVTRGQLIILDEQGSAIENRQVKFAGLDGGEEWGQFRREVTLTFEAIGGPLNVSALHAAFTPTGGAQIVLPNVDGWSGTIKTDRPTVQSAIRRESIETINAAGKWTANPELTVAQKRDALLGKKAEIEAMADCPDGLLVYGTFSKVMRIESVNADIGDTQEELTWSISAFRLRFPDGVYAELDYEVTFSDEREDNTRNVTVTGKAVAETRAHAEEEALELKTAFAAGRQFLKQDLRHRVVTGTDGSTDAIELSFTFTFRDVLGAIISFKLKVSTGYDARAGDITTTYAGSVAAASAAAALAKARDLGYGKEGAASYLINSNEEASTTGVDGVEISILVEFSYAYLGKSAIAFAEVSYDASTDFFGANGFTVTGSCTALNEAAALTFARTFKVAGLLERSIKETPAELQKSGAAYTHLVRLDFSYSYSLAAVRTTITYGKEVVHDLVARETTVNYTGTCYGPDEATCNAAIDALTVSPYAGSSLLRRSRTPQRALDVTNAINLLESVSFTDSWTAPLQITDGADILEAQYSVSKNFGLWKAVIDEIPYGVPFVQENVKRTSGVITVSGSVTVTSTNEAAGRVWARARKAFATGYLDQAEETPDYQYQPKSGTAVRSIKFGFTYASHDPALIVDF